MQNPIAGRYSPIGLDVGSRCIKAVQLARGRGGPRILAAACIDRTGEQAALTPTEAAALRAVLSRQGFRGRSVVLGGPPSQLLTAVMELPPRSSGAPLDQIARVELARASNCPPDSIELAWWELPAGTRAHEGTHVFAIGLRHEDATAALESLEAAGFEVQSLDSAVLGIARACERIGAVMPSQVTGVLDIGWSATTLAVLLGPTLVYQRRLPEAGLGALHRRLVEELKIDAEAAEFVLRRVGVLRDLPEEQQSWELLDDARTIVADHIESIGTEVKASLSYALRRYGATGSAGIVATGGGACVPGLLDRVQTISEERVRPLRASEIASAPADPLAAALAADPRLACAAGLTLMPTPTAPLEAAVT